MGTAEFILQASNVQLSDSKHLHHCPPRSKRVVGLLVLPMSRFHLGGGGGGGGGGAGEASPPNSSTSLPN